MPDTQVTVSIENLAPENGTSLTPLWVGFHNGEFDTYDRGEAATPGLERLAEDGNAAVLGDEFVASGDGSEAGVVGDAPIAPGATVEQTFTLDSEASESQYFSYASMILPSNDFFVANGDPLAHQIFDDEGNFIGSEFFILGSQVLDAGTEVNDELAETTAFFSQSEPDTGTPENGVVMAAEGFIPNGRILTAEEFAAGDFTAEGYQVARVRVTASDIVDPVGPGLPESEPVRGTALQNSAGLEVFDLRAETDAVMASFEVTREAAFDNLIGFYQIENEAGQVLAEDGVTLISPEDEGYLQAALGQRLPDVLLEGGNNQTFNSETELAPGQLLAPFLIVNSTLDALLDTNVSNDPEVFFAYTGANSDGFDHIRLLGDNTFGFEDLVGGGDQDFNDLIVQARFS